MADVQQSFDLEKLKTDPTMWMRLAMPVGKRKNLGNIFAGKENPFAQNGAAAMEKIQRLASEGKLYLREKGRSRHFRKVNADGKKLNLGDSFEARPDRNGDPIYGALMRASRAYFKWIGLDSISGWFDKRAKNYEAVRERDNRYKEEYKAMTSEQKSDLKKLRKQEKQEEKARKKLKELEKKTAEARKELDKILGKDTRDKGEMQTPLTMPPKPEENKGSMQPVHLGDDLQKERKNEPIVAQPPAQTEEPKKEEKKSEVRLSVNGQEFTKENIAQAPADVQRAFKLIEAIAEQMEKTQQTQKTEQTVQTTMMQDAATNTEELPKINEAVQTEAFTQTEEGIQAGEGLQTEEGIQAGEETQVEEANQTKDIPQVEEVKQTEEAPQVQENVPTADQKVPETEMPAPLTNPPDLEKNKVSAHGRAPEEGDLAARLAAEKQRMDAVRNWKEQIENALFSHKEGADLKGKYELLQDDPQISAIYLSMAAFGTLAETGNDPAALDKLLSGQSLGSNYDGQIRHGVENATRVSADNASGSEKPLEEFLANTVRQLSGLASQEGQLSERHVMLGRLISNAMGIAEANELTLPLSEAELAAAKGAVNLAKIARSYCDARQYLGSGPLDMTSEKGVEAVRDLLMGNAVNTMIKQDQLSGEKINSCQILMGTGIWSEEKLAQMTNSSKVRRAIQPNQVAKILEKPDSPMAHKAAKSVINEVIAQTEEIYQAQQKTAERTKEHEIERPAINPMQT